MEPASGEYNDLNISNNFSEIGRWCYYGVNINIRIENILKLTRVCLALMYSTEEDGGEGVL